MKKRIIVCCDGTWNDLEMRYITNVGRLVQALPGIGSFAKESCHYLCG
ncbi:MAG: phospholipase effector Tle1 domain-containing protein [Opitutales bacterium]